MKKIAVFTGTRAEYGLLRWVMEYIKSAPDAELQVYAGGTHLLTEYGNTLDSITGDGFEITEKLDFLLASDSAVGVSKSMGLALITAAEVLDRHQPDILVILGDRFEAMAVAQAAMIAKIPIAHIHGGETTQGAIDEAVRHSISKMSYYHFAATEIYRKRIIQLGEDPARVFNVGAPGLDSVAKLNFLNKEQLSEQLKFDLEKPFFLMTYHPVTLNDDGGLSGMQSMLSALEAFSGEYNFIITYPNADTFNKALMTKLLEFQESMKDKVLLVKSLGQLKYLSLMKLCAAVVGNSSSGIIEAPSFGVPTVNIGERQSGRIMSDSIISCCDHKDSILNAFKEATSTDFVAKCRTSKNLYGEGEVSKKIVDILLNAEPHHALLKSFYDLAFE